MMND